MPQPMVEVEKNIHRVLKLKPKAYVIVVEGSYLRRLTEERKVFKVYGYGFRRNLEVVAVAFFTDIL